LNYLYHDFRNALVILRSREAFAGLQAVLHGIEQTDVLGKHLELAEARASRGQRPHAGGQTAINAVLDERLVARGWESQPHLFDDPELENWKMDFRQSGIGVEVSFNHAEAIPWQFTRLNIAGESDRVIEDQRIDVGVVICAAPSLKKWARMDSAVGTFSQFRAWLREMRPILPVPLLLIGLEAQDWTGEEAFRGTDVGTRSRPIR
jgi:hypothetical protein